MPYSELAYFTSQPVAHCVAFEAVKVAKRRGELAARYQRGVTRARNFLK